MWCEIWILAIWHHPQHKQAGAQCESFCAVKWVYLGRLHCTYTDALPLLLDFVAPEARGRLASLHWLFFHVKAKAWSCKKNNKKKRRDVGRTKTCRVDSNLSTAFSDPMECMFATLSPKKSKIIICFWKFETIKFPKEHFFLTPWWFSLKLTTLAAFI